MMNRETAKIFTCISVFLEIAFNEAGKYYRAD